KAPPVGEMVRLVPAKPTADASELLDDRTLPPIVTDPNESPVIAVSAELPKVPPPPLPAVPMIPQPPALPVPAPPLAVPPAQKLPAVPPPVIPKTPPSPSPAPIPNVPPPAPLGAPTPFVPPTPPSIGSIILLKDGKMVEGAVTQSTDMVVVRRGSIDQPFARDQVQFIGKSKDECYRHLLGTVKADDAPGRFKLARWCMYNGLRELALGEAKEVVKLQPNMTAAAEMARALEESIRLFNPDGTAKIEAPAAPKVGAPVLPKAVEADPEIVPEAATAFAPHIQPILVNLCADCHARPGYAGVFKMACGSVQDVDAAIARHNLKAAISQIKNGDPGASPLLVKALAVHGGMKQAAFANRAAPAFRVLEAWVYIAAGSKAMPPAVPMVPPPDMKTGLPAVPPPDMKTGLPAVPPPDMKPVLPPVPPPSIPAPKFGEDALPSAPSAPNSESANAPIDDFDPSVYNRAVDAQPPSPPATGEPRP
ncbi:MAG TPA: hypothetical protein VGL71_04555, partial [Urbifossiella sp.]